MGHLGLRRTHLGATWEEHRFSDSSAALGAALGCCALAASSGRRQRSCINPSTSSRSSKLTCLAAEPVHKQAGLQHHLWGVPSSGHDRSTGLAELLLAGLVLLFSLASPAYARDRTISPSSCVGIVDAVKNCPPRKAQGALKNAEEQLRLAEQRLRAAEEVAGKKLGPRESKNGEPEMVVYWSKELQRLDLNKRYLEKVRRTFAAPADENNTPLVVSRVRILAADVAKEARFWCEGVGMQIYEELPSGGRVVAYGPQGLDGDEGGFFAIEIQPISAALEGPNADLPPKAVPKLSFVQIASPTYLRISKVLDSGGELLDSYGFWELKSPAGVVLRAYIEDRRDPVELVALAVEESGMSQVRTELESLGFKASGAYVRVSPVMQEYMPDLVPGNELFVSGDPTESTQLLLEPLGGPQVVAPKPFLTLPQIFTDEKEGFGLDFADDPDELVVPVSTAPSPRLTILSNKNKSPATAFTLGERGDGLVVEVRQPARS